jgi:hypothetical protein
MRSRMRDRMRHLPRLAVVALASGAGALGACHRGAQGAGESAPASPSEPALVIFSNESSYEAALYAISSTGRQLRLGTAQPGRKDTLRVSGGGLLLTGSVTFVARLRTINRSLSSGSFTLSPGQHIAVTIPIDARTLTLLPAQ